MTEKRFVLEDEVIIDNNSIADDGGRQLYWTVEYVQRQKLVDLMNTLAEENEQLKASLYAEKTNTAEVVNDYSKQFKRHSAQFSFMMDLADDLGVDVTTLEALDD